MNQDQIERDRLLTEVHTNVKNMVEWSKKHDIHDDQRFVKVDSDIEWLKRLAGIGIGAILTINIILKLIK